MSFIEINERVGKTYHPGWFLAHEECTRETFEADASNSAVETAGNGGKYLPMGTIYPAADATAVGIVYEDVDVTSGNMPGSLVTEGTVYENRLPEAEDSYSSVTPAGTENPKEEGWYEKDGNEYELTTDTTVTEGTTYYEYDGKLIPSTAKTALAALGFKFVTEPEVTRPAED